MSKIKPFKALRPISERAKKVSSVPYDVVNRDEAREIAKNNPLSFLHVSRSEIDLADDANPYADEVYERAKKNLQALQADGTLRFETESSFYIYRLKMGEQVQTSIVATCAIDEYDTDLIKKHEKTRPDKENDRTKHITAVQAQTGLIFLCYRGTETINSLVDTITATEPIYDFISEDKISHTVWQTTATENLVSAFTEIPSIYIADGHHRAASASRARAEMQRANGHHTGEEDYNFVIAALFPAEQLKILAYNRVVKDLNGLSEEQFLQSINESGFIVADTENSVPDNEGEICVYLSGKWRKMTFNVQYFVAPPVIESLDVSRLETFVLKPILGIEDVRTDKRIDFVGGIRGTEELEKLVDSGKAKVAFSMFPTTVEQLLAVSDDNQIMPPKSTWFEPKLRDGLLIHKI
jgi:uncharacterized protein (DUF1015 family)